MAERTFHQVISVFVLPKDLHPFSFSFNSIVMDNPAYVTSSFDAYVETSRDYATWFTESSMGPFMGDVPVNGGRVLGGIVCAQVASGAE